MSPSALESHSLGSQSLVLILPPGSAHPEGAPLDLATLEETPFVVAPRGTSTFRLLHEALAAVNRSPSLAVVTAQRDAILPLVIAGAGAALGARVGGPHRLGVGRGHRPPGAAHRAGARPGPPVRPALTGRRPVHRDGDTVTHGLTFGIKGWEVLLIP